MAALIMVGRMMARAFGVGTPPVVSTTWELEAGGDWELEAGGTWDLE